MVVVNNEKCYTVKEAAQVLNVLEGSVRSLIRRNALKAEKVGSIYLIKDSDLKELIKRRESK